MEEKISRSKYLIITAILCLGLVFNLLNWQNQSIGLAFGLMYVAFYSFIFGSIFVSKKGWQIITGFIFTLAFIAVSSSFFLYFLKFNNYAYVLIIFLLPALLITPYYYSPLREKLSLKNTIKKYFKKLTQRKEPKINLTLVAIYLILTTGCFYILGLGQVSSSIQSPWQVVPTQYFAMYFFATVTLLVYLLNSTRTKLPLILISVHTFLSSSVALIIYKIGYGFDPFIHQAAEKIISQTGTITPITPYYLGQYGIVLFLQKLTLINLELIDKLLVPTLFAILLPAIIYYVFSHWIEKNYALVLSLSSLIIPFSSFIMTTPQNLANLFFILTILLSLLYFRNQIHILVLYLLAFATLAIHPLAGIPLLTTVILFNLFKLFYSSYHRNISLYFLAGLIFVIFLPLAFIANGSELILSLPDIKKADLIWVGWVNNFNLPLNLVYLISLNKIVLSMLVIGAGLSTIIKNKLLKNNAAYLMAALVLFINFFIIKYFLTFPDLRSFDSGSFVSRLLTLTFYALIPFFLLGLYVIIKKFWTQNWFFKSALIMVIASVITSSLYLSYPTADDYRPAKFFSLSESDIKAAHYITQGANPNHIVLANQMVGVAAIKEFGFKKYYNGQFYYSMPNGATTTFYDGYLDMIYEGAQRKTMESVMNEAGVTESYFVLNSYWRNFEKIAKQATVSADEVANIDNGQILIFKYVLN